jgi:CBS domain-containing protein
MSRVKDLMTKDVITIDSEKTVLEAAGLMSQKEVGDLIVTHCQIPVGIVTERDIVRRVVAKEIPLGIRVAEIMSSPLVTVDPDVSLEEAAGKMVENRIRRLAVMRGNDLVGIVAASDFARHLSKKTFTNGLLEAMERHPLTFSRHAGLR